MQFSAAMQGLCVIAALVVVVAGSDGAWSADGNRARMHKMLAFPRMGRSGFLAFPRMGRAGGEGAAAPEGGEGCCPVGLRLEWSAGEGGKPHVTDVCEMEAGCCPGLEEVVRRKPAGGFYSMCLAPCNGGSGSGSNSFDKLKDMLSR